MIPIGRSRMAAASLAAALLVATAACGTSNPSSTVKAQGDSACAKAAADRLDAAQSPAKMSLPKESVDASQAQGKKVWFIAAGMQFPLVKTLAEEFEEAAEVAGLDGTVFDGKASVPTWVEGVKQAVAQKADVIILDGQDPDVLTGPLRDAQRAGIPVVSFAAYARPDLKPADGPISVYTGLDLEAIGRMQADYALANSGCQGGHLVLTSDISKTLQAMASTAQKSIETHCADCRVQVQTVNSQSFNVDTPQAARTAVQKDPDLRYIIAPDIYSMLVVPALKQLGPAAEDVGIIGYQGDPPNLQLVKAGGHQVADFSYPPLGYVSWTLVDLSLRALAGSLSSEPILFDSHLVTKASFDAGDPFAEFGDYKSGYTQLWNVGAK